MADSIFHKDFKATPWWWEWWHPSNELSQDPPLRTDVLVVGAGGLGQLLYVELSLFHYAQASTVIIAMLALSMAVDQASAWLRIKMR